MPPINETNRDHKIRNPNYSWPQVESGALKGGFIPFFQPNVWETATIWWLLQQLKICKNRLMIYMEMKNSYRLENLLGWFLLFGICSLPQHPQVAQFERIPIGRCRYETAPKVEIITMQNPTEDEDSDFVIKCSSFFGTTAGTHGKVWILCHTFCSASDRLRQ